MPTPSSFEYAVVRVVPRVDREEFINAGVIVFCLQQKFLAAKVGVDEPRLVALWPSIDVGTVEQHLSAIPRICAGDLDAGPIAEMPVRERFRWLVSPRSTMIQISAVHGGLCDHPELTLHRLYQQFVEQA